MICICTRGYLHHNLSNCAAIIFWLFHLRIRIQSDNIPGKNLLKLNIRRLEFVVAMIEEPRKKNKSSELSLIKNAIELLIYADVSIRLVHSQTNFDCINISIN